MTPARHAASLSQILWVSMLADLSRHCDSAARFGAPGLERARAGCVALVLLMGERPRGKLQMGNAGRSPAPANMRMDLLCTKATSCNAEPLIEAHLADQ